MAHINKTKRSGVANLVKHDERKTKNNSNENIDESRTPLNYDYNQGLDGMTRYESLLSNAEVKILNRKDVNTMCDIVITLPKGFDDLERDFFNSCMDFLRAKFIRTADKDCPIDNLVSAVVHKDESQPHLHFKFMPIVKNKGKSKERYPWKCSFDECVTRQVYRTFHEELQNHIGNKVGWEIAEQILNGATKDGNKSVEELKRMSASEDYRAFKQYQSDKNIALDELNALNRKIRGHKNELEGLQVQINFQNANIESKEHELEQVTQSVQQQETYLCNHSEVTQAFSEQLKDYRSQIVGLQEQIKQLSDKLTPEQIDDYLQSKGITVDMDKLISSYNQAVKEVPTNEKAKKSVQTSKQKTFIYKSSKGRTGCFTRKGQWVGTLKEVKEKFPGAKILDPYKKKDSR